MRRRRARRRAGHRRPVRRRSGRRGVRGGPPGVSPRPLDGDPCPVPFVWGWGKPRCLGGVPRPRANGRDGGFGHSCAAPFSGPVW
ncbi:hypothetical protein C6N75_29690 [Streptomyces solincola]|uniref:Uncharacterized protein n=1 Tax=Streptomyces solincola TaxID=2100817 RepID=A0A2S9PMN1_9ACTN|nr:hypothetical protein C6N75_29690 [Streptomyces solincola]